MLSNDSPVMIIVAGKDPENGWDKLLLNVFPRAIMVTPEVSSSLEDGAEDLIRQVREAGVISNSWRVIAHSWGAKLTEQVVAGYPGLISKAVLIARPGFEEFRWMPSFVSALLRPDEDRSGLTKYFVIAGIDPKAPARWWMMPNENGVVQSDGVVSVKEATTLTGGRKAEEILVITGEEGEHTRILSSEIVLSQAKAWLETETLVATVVTRD